MAILFEEIQNWLDDKRGQGNFVLQKEPILENEFCVVYIPVSKKFLETKDKRFTYSHTPIMFDKVKSEPQFLGNPFLIQEDVDEYIDKMGYGNGGAVHDKR